MMSVDDLFKCHPRIGRFMRHSLKCGNKWENKKINGVIQREEENLKTPKQMSELGRVQREKVGAAKHSLNITIRQVEYAVYDLVKMDARPD
jgi:hypothetical protein